MSKLRGFLCLASAAILGVSLNAVAQSTTQGAISGTVFDATDAVISNAKITIHNDGTNQDVVLTSAGSGEFKAPLLQPGTYTVTVDATGFSASRTTGVVVQVNQVTTINPHLSTGSTEQTVEVSADVPVLDFSSAQFGGHLSTHEIENLPINGRRWSSLTLLTPGAVADSNGFGLISFRAMSPLLNVVQIDGADNNQAFYAEERGRTRVGYSTSQVAVREFQVNTGVYSAELGRAVGGVVNTVTKSGSNSLHGELYFYDRDNTWGAFNPYTTNTRFNSTTNAYENYRYKPKDWRKQWGFGVGGPIIKDKLFWFYAYDQYKRNFPGTAKAGTPSVFFLTPANLTAQQTCNTTTGSIVVATGGAAATTAQTQACTLASRLNSTYSAAQTLYNNNLSELLTDLGSVPRTGDQVINTPKVDWHINNKHVASFLYHRLRWDSPGGVQTQATNTYAIDSFGTDFVKLDYGMARLSSLISSNLTNELRYQYGRELNWQGAQPYSAYTRNRLTGTSGIPLEVSLYSSTGFTMGIPYYSFRKSYPDERKWQIGDTMSWTHGKHTLKFGEDIIHNYDLQDNLYRSNGQINYTNLADYISDLQAPNGACDSNRSNARPTGTAYPCYSSFNQGFGPSAFDLSTMDYGFFVQDDWKITPRLTLNLGARYDYESFPSPYAALYNSAYPGTANKPNDKNNIAPRLGFAWDPFGKGKTVVRGGYGMFYGRVPNSIILNVYYNTGSANSQVQYSLQNNAAGAPKFPNSLASRPATGAGTAPAIQYFDSHFSNPYAHEFDLTVQQDLGKANVLSLSYVGSLGRQLPNFINTNLNPNTTYNTTLTVTPASNGDYGPLGQGTLTTKVYSNSYLNSAFSSTTGVFSNINSSYNAFTVDMTNRTWKLISYDVNYTWSHALDFNQNQSTNPTTNNWFDPYVNARANYGNSNFNVPNRIVAWALMNVPGVSANSPWKWVANGWSLKPLFQGQNGLPYSLTLSGSVPNGSGLTRAGSGLSGTGVTYIPQIGRNSRTQPRTMVFDVRAQKSFTFAEKYNLELAADAFNLANHQNVTSVNTLGYTISGTNMQYNSAAGTPQNSNSNFIYSPRQVQVALRLTF